jgi:hypothetical protein
VVEIRTALEPAEAQRKLDELDERWWLDALPLGEHRVVITLAWG